MGHYQRSSCHNPFVASPQYWEHPIGVATRTTPKTAWAPLGKPRPVNKRNYWSPSFWVQQVEKGEAPSCCTYLDYAFTDDFNQVQKEVIKKEQFHQQNAKGRLRKSSTSISKGRPTTVNLGVGESASRSSFAREGLGKS